MDSYQDHRSQALNNRIAGWWFTNNRTKAKKRIELVGRGIAFTMRVILLKSIGTETFTFGMFMVGLLWMRLCTCISIPEGVVENRIYQVFNPFAFHGWETGLLNLASLFFLGACIWYVVRTEFFRDTPDVLEHGETNLLKPLVKEDGTVFTTDSFVQSTISPLIGLAIGLVIWRSDVWFGMSLYLSVSSVALLIDEVNYHRAVIRRWRLEMANRRRAKKLSDKHDKWKRDNPDEE
jgi:hypothetical protein